MPVRRILALTASARALGEIGFGINICVANAFEMREHGHACRFVLDAGDQAFAAARHDHLDCAVQAADSIMPTAARSVVGTSWEWRMLAPAARKPSASAAWIAAEEWADPAAAAQDRRIAGFYGHARRHRPVTIGAAFVNDAEHADGRGDARDMEPVGPRPACQRAAYRIRQCRNLVHAFGHRRHAFVIEQQPVEHCRRKAAFAPSRHVFRVGREDRILVRREWLARPLASALVLASGEASRSATAPSRAQRPSAFIVAFQIVRGISPLARAHLSRFPLSDPLSASTL